jgi:hypothetical protein
VGLPDFLDFSDLPGGEFLICAVFLGGLVTLQS